MRSPPPFLWRPLGLVTAYFLNPAPVYRLTKRRGTVCIVLQCVRVSISVSVVCVLSNDQLIISTSRRRRIYRTTAAIIITIIIIKAAHTGATTV